MPIGTLATAMIIYFLAYGKSSRNLKPIATILLIVSIIVASSLTLNMINLFSSNNELNSTFLFYLGSGLSAVAWLLNSIVVGLIFYGVHSDN